MASITAVSTRPKPRAKKAPKPVTEVAVEVPQVPEVPLEKSGWTYFWNDERITEAVYFQRVLEHAEWVKEEEKKKELLRLAATPEKKTRAKK